MQGFAYKRYMKACSSHIEGAVKLDLNAMRHEYWRSLTLMDAFGTMHAWAVSSAVRASGLHPEGRVFKSRTAHHSPGYSGIAPSGLVPHKQNAARLSPFANPPPFGISLTH